MLLVWLFVYLLRVDIHLFNTLIEVSVSDAYMYTMKTVVVP